MIDTYNQFGGIHSETAAVRHLLAHEGITNPHTGQPITEALLFGVGFGIGASYFNFDYQLEEMAPTLSINMLGRYKAKYGEVVQRLCRRLGLDVEAKTTGSVNVAFQNLQSRLAAGQPVIVYAGPGALPYYPSQAYERYAERAAVVYAIDSQADQVHLAELPAAPLIVTVNELAAARTAFNPLRHLSLVVKPPQRPLTDLKEAVTAGIHGTVEPMINPPTPANNFGLKALRKWADLLLDKGERGWSRMFAPGPALYQALAGVFAQIEQVGVGGGGLRGLYAAFLIEAADILETPGLGDVAARYHSAAELWTNLAEAALPEHEPDFRRTKDLLRRKQQLFLEAGTAELSTLIEINEEQAAIAARMEEDFPLDAAESQALLADLQQHVLQVYEAEKEAIEALEGEIS